jgi:hypothetical protein
MGSPEVVAEEVAGEGVGLDTVAVVVFVTVTPTVVFASNSTEEDGVRLGLRRMVPTITAITKILKADRRCITTGFILFM